MENDTEPPTRWLIYSTIFLSCFFIFSSTSFAAEAEYDPGTISGWFKPSGVGHSNYEYKWYYRSWVNECPACHSHHLAYNPKGVPEGEVTCLDCSADFDGVTGWEKQYNPRWRLTPATEVKKETKEETKTETVPKVQAAQAVNRHQWLVNEWNNWNKSNSLLMGV